MDPFIGGALISGATSLLGGLFGRSSAKKDLAMQRQLINEQNEYNNPTNIRKRAEEGGFNPVSFIGPGVGLQTQTAQVNSGNYMGAAIADAGMAFAGAMADKAKFAETKKLNDLEMANAKLQNKILQLTLRPKVGGVYADRQSTPTIAAAVGGGNEVSSQGVSGSSAGVLSYGDVGSGFASSGSVVGPDGLLTKHAFDPRRKVENSPVTTEAGFTVVDNPAFGLPFPVPTFQGEVPELNQLPVIVGAWAADRIMRFANRPPESTRYRSPAPVQRPKSARVIPGGDVTLINPRTLGKQRAAIEAVDPAYDPRPKAPSWHKHRVKAWWQ